MVSSLPAGARAIAALEVPEPADEQPLDAKAARDLRWLPRSARRRRGHPPAGDPERLAAALTGVRLPDGHGHAYLFGEAKVVLALREMVANRGLTADQVSPKAYWGRGKANASARRARPGQLGP